MEKISALQYQKFSLCILKDGKIKTNFISMTYSTDDGDEKITRYLSTTSMERTLEEHLLRWENNIKIEPKVNNVGESELV